MPVIARFGRLGLAKEINGRIRKAIVIFVNGDILPIFACSFKEQGGKRRTAIESKRFNVLNGFRKLDPSERDAAFENAFANIANAARARDFERSQGDAAAESIRANVGCTHRKSD